MLTWANSFDSSTRKDAIHSMAQHVSESNYTTYRKFLVASLILNSGARTGVIANMSMSDVGNAEFIRSQGRSYRVVSVTAHKTAYSGPFQIPLGPEEYAALKNVANYVHNKYPEASSPFVTGDGNPVNTSRITREWRGLGEARRCLLNMDSSVQMTTGSSLFQPF